MVQPAVARGAKLVPGTAIRIRGRANRHGFAVSSYDLDGEVETGDFAPVYPATEDVAQKTLRELHAQALAFVRDLGDDLPCGRARRGAAARLRADALAAIHRPRSLPEAEVGRTRLAFDELSSCGWRSCAPRRRAQAPPRSGSARRAS